MLQPGAVHHQTSATVLRCSQNTDSSDLHCLMTFVGREDVREPGDVSSDVACDPTIRLNNILRRLL
jgi:hypothetical protein